MGSRISAATYLEASIVIDRWPDPLVRRRLDDMLAVGSFVIEPVTERRLSWPKGCLSGLRQGEWTPGRTELRRLLRVRPRRDLDEPLLFKGDDFRHTDIPFVGEPSERRRLNELWA